MVELLPIIGRGISSGFVILRALFST
jgi:hypothetical protein